jgi:hypothetical protein
MSPKTVTEAGTGVKADMKDYRLLRRTLSIVDYPFAAWIDGPWVGPDCST